MAEDARSDPGLYDYSPWPGRPKLTWPDGAKVAFWVSQIVVRSSPDTTFPRRNSMTPCCVVARMRCCREAR